MSQRNDPRLTHTEADGGIYFYGGGIREFNGFIHVTSLVLATLKDIQRDSTEGRRGRRRRRLGNKDGQGSNALIESVCISTLSPAQIRRV